MSTKNRMRPLRCTPAAGFGRPIRAAAPGESRVGWSGTRPLAFINRAHLLRGVPEELQDAAVVLDGARKPGVVAGGKRVDERHEARLVRPQLRGGRSAGVRVSDGRVRRAALARGCARARGQHHLKCCAEAPVRLPQPGVTAGRPAQPTSSTIAWG
jgi:hypothetical protein